MPTNKNKKGKKAGKKQDAPSTASLTAAPSDGPVWDVNDLQFKSSLTTVVQRLISKAAEKSICFHGSDRSIFLQGGDERWIEAMVEYVTVRKNDALTPFDPVAAVSKQLQFNFRYLALLSDSDFSKFLFAFCADVFLNEEAAGFDRSYRVLA